MQETLPLVDLHVHSNKSDGSFSPTELVDYAAEKGLHAFALTDHDTTAGIDEAISYAAYAAKPVEVIPGIEFSTEYEGRDIHILGLCIKHHSAAFQSRIQDFVDSRINRNRKMCQNLQNAGIDISYENLIEAFPDSVITRAHYARYLLEQGYIKNLAEAFERYIGDNCSCFVPREKVTPQQAIQLILASDGFPVLAHPLLYHMNRARLETLIASLKEAGLRGMECLYSTHTAAETREMHKLARKYGLLVSGGSDFHGSAKPRLDLGSGYGSLAVPLTVLEQIQKNLASKRNPLQ